MPCLSVSPHEWEGDGMLRIFANLVLAATLTPGALPAIAQTGQTLAAAERAAVFKAAGAVKRGAKWVICTDDPQAEGAAIESVSDLNGDGRPEALITEGGMFCYGNTGAAFALVGEQADGSWKLLTTETGMANFLKTKGVGGWPDIEVGRPRLLLRSAALERPCLCVPPQGI